MRLKEIILNNFRGYRKKTSIPIHGDLTGIIGKNDAGKSTILEALDIFFDGPTTFDNDDFNVGNSESPVEITCIFDDLPDAILVDENNTTTLQAEYLLNENGDLEILKRIKSATAKGTTTFLVAHHPSEPSCENLHTLKMADLKTRAKGLGIDGKDITDARTSAAWRVAIWQSAGDLQLKNSQLDLGKFSSESKNIQDKIFSLLPLFALFKSDRECKDNDPQAKDPLQNAVAEAKKELQTEIDRIYDEIRVKVLDRAQKTLDKLRDMDPGLASELTPRFKKAPTLSFDFTLDGEDSVPINKRGSGFRRLILLNFFRAEAERQVTSRNAPSVIYAFEEPETSQHPSNQEMLIKALLKLSHRKNCQVLVTTHVPALAGMLPTDGLRFVEKINGSPAVRFGDESVLRDIADSLGVHVDPLASKAKALLLVEGEGDVVFVRHAANKLKEGGHLPCTLEEKGILPVIIGGCGNLKHWRTKKIADQFGVPWATLLDSDKGTPEESKNKKAIEELLAEGKKAYLTRKREPENYIAIEVVMPFVKQELTLVDYSDLCDAKTLIGRSTLVRGADVLERFWTLMTTDQIRNAERYVDDEGKDRYELTEILSDVLKII